MDVTPTKRAGRKSKVIPPDDAPNQAQRLRLERNLSIAEIARHLHVSDSSVNQFELKGTGIGRRKQFELALLLEVEVQELLTPGKNFVEKIRLSLDIIR